MHEQNHVGSKTIEQNIEDWCRSNLPAYEFMDLKVTSVSGGVYRCFVPLTRNTGNHINTVHAAFQWAAAEMVGGLPVLARRKDEKYVPVVKGVNIQFKRPAFSDITAEAKFSEEDVQAMNEALASTGRYDFELSSSIRNAEGEIVAQATGFYAVITME